MALGSNHVTGSGVAAGTASTFIPELWSDEIIAAYQHRLVMKPLVKQLKMTGKKGDTIHIPMPTRGAVSAKVAETQVTLTAATESEKVLKVDQHWQISRLIEDITEKQALSSLRRFYTQDAGYALAKKVDTDLLAEGANFTTKLAANAGGASTTVTPGTAVAFNDSSFRDAIQALDDLDVPMDGRKLVIPPAARNAIMGIDRYVSSDFVNGRGVVNGKIGELYGIDIYVSTNLTKNGSGEFNALLFHTDAIVMVEQMGVRTQSQYKQEWLADLMTADMIYGSDVYRPDNGVQLLVAG